ncbi:MAG TPA: adenylyltransferase/cytidyltransferase family protein [Chloroflexia bacterium]|jgi:HTH-type transcriptional repressor of NAD biosynthesis genes
MAQGVEGGRARTGLILGKFMPLTAGHCYLIDTALAQVEHLTILVCTLPTEPIDGHLRWQWVHETYPQCRVLHVTEALPSYPHEHPDFWTLWKSLIRGYAPDLDVVFTGEEYGDKLAEVLGCRHVCVDRFKGSVPISATMIRQDPLGNWGYIAPAVRPYYAKATQDG